MGVRIPSASHRAWGDGGSCHGGSRGCGHRGGGSGRAVTRCQPGVTGARVFTAAGGRSCPGGVGAGSPPRAGVEAGAHGPLLQERERARGWGGGGGAPLSCRSRCPMMGMGDTPGTGCHHARGTRGVGCQGSHLHGVGERVSAERAGGRGWPLAQRVAEVGDVAGGQDEDVQLGELGAGGHGGQGGLQRHERPPQRPHAAALPRRVLGARRHRGALRRELGGGC